MKPLKRVSELFHRSRGQVMVMFAMFLVVLMGFIALSLDVGYLLAERRGVQNAADAAAMAGGRLILLEDTTTIHEQAREYVNKNGYDGDTAQVDLPDSSTIAVDLTEDVEPFFLGVLYDGPWQVSAHAVATVIHEIKDVGLLALGENPGKCEGNPGNSTGIHFGGNAYLDISASVLSNGCIVFNGNATEGQIDDSVEAHSEVQDIPDNLDVDEEGILEGQPLVEDPFENLSPDPPGVCSTAALNPEDYEDPSDSNHLILEPGHYGEIKRWDDISLRAGEYCFTGLVQVGGFIKSFDDDNSNGEPDAGEYHHEKGENDGGGVLLYFGSNGELQMTSADEGLAVKTLGEDWEEIVIWYANCHKNKDLQIKGNDNMWIVGVIYAPCSTVNLTGSSNSEVPIGAIIAKKIEIGGTPSLNFNSSVTIEIEPPRVYLVE